MDGAGTFFSQVVEICSNLFNSQELIRILSQPEFLIATYVVLTLVIFTETGLLAGFFLPGDSLLVSTGIVWHQLVYVHGVSIWTLPLLLVLLCLAAIVGDSVGYAIGAKAGPRIFRREKSFFFNKDHLLKAQAFYERHGGKTIILARFMPLLRTFAPVVAGIGNMNYRQFLFYNIFGGIGWVLSMVLIGFFLPPVLQQFFGDRFLVQEHIEKVIVVVVLISISPAIIAWARAKFFKKAPIVEPTAINP